MTEAVAAGSGVRQAVAGDLAGVETLLRSAALPVEGLAEQFEDGFVVGEAEGALAGAAGLEVYGAYGLLRSVVVDPAWRGGGLGAALVRNRLEWAARRGVRRVYLLTTTAPAWFSRLGFHSVARDDVPAAVRRSAEFMGVCPSSAAVMEYDLAGMAAPCCGPVVVRVGQDREIDPSDADALKATVREKYGEAATRAAGGAPSSCCGPSADEAWDPITAELYEEGETAGLPMEAVLASLGCGNPTALASLAEGETVLDLGSGGGIDVLLSARRVGARGRVYGLDMTDEMLELARANQARAGVTNVEFLKGDIEAIPLPDASVDVIISNCVINLAADKGRVLREAFRVLRPGGRLAVSDIVAARPVPELIRRSVELWMGCVAGALDRDTYGRLLAEAGFAGISLEPTRVYGASDARYFLEGAGLPVPADLAEFDGAFMSAFVRAGKPRD
jgi:arsenite methyltransferase